MYRLTEAQKHPLLPWVVRVTPEGYARCWVWRGRGSGWDGSTAALRGIVDTGVRALQTKYRERAEAVMERYRESRDRAAAVESLAGEVATGKGCCLRCRASMNSRAARTIFMRSSSCVR